MVRSRRQAKTYDRCRDIKIQTQFRRFNTRLKGKEEFLTKTYDFHDVLSLRNEIGTCPFMEVHLKLKDKSPFL